ncbi:hypothetical protein AB1Y20_013846 [Prymnesium parvum]|uniref:C2H2-type domain-containing protein n=1 Tax=Prymnesium parvum TaxID=97485 RepID=A0AB34IER7_PRYPA
MGEDTSPASPPLSEDDALLQKALALAMAEAAAPPPAPTAPPAPLPPPPAAEESVYVCEYTRKRFKTRAAYENHTKSRKYQLLAEKAEAARRHNWAHMQRPPAAPAEGGGEEELLAREMARLSAASDAAATGGEAEGSSEGEWEDEEEQWLPRWNESLFDEHTSASFEANVGYMQRAHSFYVPHLQHLVDARGLFAFLQRKIHLDHACVFCGRAFASLDACRKHMKAKAHCKLDVDRDERARELAPFYDFPPPPPRRRGGAAPFVDGEGGELVLSDGTRLGHRSLRHLYKQRWRNEDTFLALRGEGAAAYGRLYAGLAARAEARAARAALVRAHAYAKGQSKALAASFHFKADEAYNKRAHAIVHHWGAGGGGSHYHMAGSRAFHRGKQKGMVLRHSRQGAKMQAARAASRAAAMNKGNRGNASVAVLR